MIRVSLLNEYRQIGFRKRNIISDRDQGSGLLLKVFGDNSLSISSLIRKAIKWRLYGLIVSIVSTQMNALFQRDRHSTKDYVPLWEWLQIFDAPPSWSKIRATEDIPERMTMSISLGSETQIHIDTYPILNLTRCTPENRIFMAVEQFAAQQIHVNTIS